MGLFEEERILSEAEKVYEEAKKIVEEAEKEVGRQLTPEEVDELLMGEDEEENEEYLEGVSDIETLIDILDYKDEEARRERLNDFKFKPSKETLNSELAKEIKIMAESFVMGVKILVEGGIDYVNAINLCNNHLIAKQNVKLSEINQANIDKTSI
jgi:hypothetical protein